MKYFTLLLLLFVFKNVSAQDGLLPLDADKNIYYADSGQPKLSKAEQYKKVQEWVVKSFGNYQNAVSFEDSLGGVLRITSYVPAIHARYAYIRFDLTVTCEDNQYRADIKNLDGISTVHSPERLGSKENEAIKAGEVLIKAENNRKTKVKLEDDLKLLKADNEGINTAMYNLLATLKRSII